MWLRREHGSHPVKALAVENGIHWEVDYGDHKEVFEGFRPLARKLFGYSSGWTADRYFRIGLYRLDRPKVGILDYFHPTKPLEKAVPPGIDLLNRSDEVAKLLNYACGSAIRHYDYDFDDVLQDVYKGIIARNNGKSPWDPDRSSFGNYVILVSQSVFRNYHARQQRIRSREQIGTRTLKGSEYVTVDASELGVTEPDWGQIGVVEVMDDLLTTMQSIEGSHKSEARLARQILPLVYKGMKRSEIADELDIGVAVVGRALSWLRGAAKEWVEDSV